MYNSPLCWIAIFVIWVLCFFLQKVLHSTHKTSKLKFNKGILKTICPGQILKNKKLNITNVNFTDQSIWYNNNLWFNNVLNKMQNKNRQNMHVFQYLLNMVLFTCCIIWNIVKYKVLILLLQQIEKRKLYTWNDRYSCFLLKTTKLKMGLK